MDEIDLDFNQFLRKVDKLENIINKSVKNKEITSSLLKKYGICIDGIDCEYRQLLIDKLLEDLINNEIFYLIK